MSDTAVRCPRLRFRLKAHRELRQRVFGRDDFTCQGCGWRPPDEAIPADYDGRYCIGFWPNPSAERILEIDHILPRAAGGQNILSNLQALCEPCNRRKGART